MFRVKSLMAAGAALVALNIGGMALAQTDPMVGGAAMYPSKTIVQNAVNSKDHTTLVAAVTAAGLVDTLNSKGPFTVFAPTNEAFDKLPPGAVAGLLNQPDHATLKKVLTYHVVPGVWDSRTLAKAITDGGGHATLKTVEGEPIIVGMSDGRVVLTDAHNGNAYVTIADVYQSNGVIHVIDTVLQP